MFSDDSITGSKNPTQTPINDESVGGHPDISSSPGHLKTIPCQVNNCG